MPLPGATGRRWEMGVACKTDVVPVPMTLCSATLGNVWVYFNRNLLMEEKHRLIRQRVKGEGRYVERREVALETECIR